MAASGCSQQTDHTDRSRPHTGDAAAALSAHHARRIIAHYSTVNNRANAHRNRALLSTVEDGPLYAQSVAGYKETEAQPPNKRRHERRWSYDAAHARLYIPRAHRRWFAAALSTRRGTPDRLAVFAQRPRHRWKMVMVTDLAGRTLPAVARDRQGFATAIDPRHNRLAADPRVLASGIADNFATGGKGDAKTIFAPAAAGRRQITTGVRARRRFGSQALTTFAAARNRFPTGYALKTANGRALVLFSHEHTQTDRVARPGLEFTPSPRDRAWLHDQPRRVITYRFSCSDAALVPDHPGRSQLLGYSCARTSAHGPTEPH